MKILISVLLILTLYSCSESSEDEEKSQTGLQVETLGTSNFGGVIIGGTKDAAFRITNFGPNNYELNLEILEPFQVISKSVNCSNDVIKINESCVISVRFSPTAEGAFEQNISLDDQQILFKGVGLLNGVLVLSDEIWDLGLRTAGQFISKNFTIQNLGDLTARTPSFNLPSYITVGFNECGSFIAPQTSCRFNLEARLNEAIVYDEVFRLESENGGNLEIQFNAEVTPSTPSGLITFESVPQSMSSAGEEFNIVTNEITDAFGNIVEDGQTVIVNVNSNLLLLAGNQYTTQDGKINFAIRTRTIKGDGNISIVSNQASGFINFPITAGEPFGNITVSSSLDGVPANGLTQILVRTNSIFDQYGNLIEDGTPIKFELIGSGSLSSGANSKEFTALSINGQVSAVVQSGTVAEEVTVRIKGGPIYNNLNEIIGYSANGEIKLNFESGPAFGEFPITSTFNAIYANSNPPSDISIPAETIVTIGPLTDEFGNIVKENSEVQVEIENGFNISGTIPEDNFSLLTDANGFTSFNLIGDNQRGNIVITAVSSSAQKIYNVWGYLRNRLSYSSSSNDVDVFFRHNDSTVVPSPLIPWGRALIPDSSGELDGIFYGYEKESDIAKTNFSANTEFPYFNWDCFFTAGDDLLTNFCLQPDNFLSPMYRYTRNHDLQIEGLEFNDTPELVLNTNFNIQNKLDFWGGVSNNPFGAKWSSSNNGMMWIDNRDPLDPENDEVKKRGISDWIDIDPTKKYLLTFIMREQIGDNDNRFGEVGIIEGDRALINDPAYNLPDPIILRDQLFGTAIVDRTQRVVYTPTGDSDIIRLYFSTKGAGNRAEVKYDDVSFKELNTQNVHYNFTQYANYSNEQQCFEGSDFESNSPFICLSQCIDGFYNSVLGYWECTEATLLNTSQPPRINNGEGISIGYMKDLDQLLMFGGNNLIDMAYDCDIDEDGNFFEKCHNFQIERTNQTTLLRKIQDPSSGVLVTEYDENSNFDLGTPPTSQGHKPMTSLDNEILSFGGFISGGVGSTSADNLMTFNGLTSKWITLNVQEDTSIIDELNRMPKNRYQNGILYIPELNNVYVMGGITQDEEDDTQWNLNDDMWKVNLDNRNSLIWENICLTCNLFESLYTDLGNIQNSLENFPDFPGKINLYRDAINNLKRTNTFWHSATQTAYVFIPETNFMKYFDPYSETFGNADEQGLLELIDSFQILYNDKTGRTYGYKRGIPFRNDSQIWYWDMNRDEKQYVRYQFNLANNAKDFMQEMNFKIYAYGNSNTIRNTGNFPVNGIEAYIFDHDNNTWVSMGFNESSNNQDAQNALEYSITNSVNAKKFVSSSGKVDIVLTPRGRPGFNGGETLMGDDLETVNVGLNNFNQPITITDISTNSRSSCALTIDGDVKCWGRNDYGQLGLGLSTPSVGESINEMGSNLRSAILFDSANPSNNGLEVEKIYSGKYHSCAIFNNKKIKCWGRNDYGQLGFYSESSSIGDGFGEMGDNLPFVDLGNKNGTIGSEEVEVEKLALGEYHTCAYLKVNNEKDIHKVKCWGRNNFGQLGYGDNNDRGLNPNDMGNNLLYVSTLTVFDNITLKNRKGEIYNLTTGDNHTCVAVESDSGKTIQCWGANFDDQLSLSLNQDNSKNLTNQNLPKLTRYQIIDVYKLEAGGDHTCMYYNNSLNDETLCWGRNNFGQLGRGGSDQPLLVQIPQDLEFEFRNEGFVEPIPITDNFTQGVESEPDARFKKVTIFDSEFSNRIQFDHLSSHDIVDQDFVIEMEIDPRLQGREMPLLSKIALSTGIHNTTEITQVGGWILSINDQDKLEFYSENIGKVAESVKLDERFQSIRVVRDFDVNKGYNRIRFYRYDGIQWIDITSSLFDYNLDSVDLSNSTDAPLVIGSVYDDSPVIGPQRDDFYKGSIGYIFLKIGSNNINFIDGSIPADDILSNRVELGTGLIVEDFALGEDHSCVIFTSKEAKCFGENTFGQTGNNYEFDNIGSSLNDMGDELPFLDLGDGNLIEKISSGTSHNCALLSNGQIKCWGNNGFGQLGQEDTLLRGRGAPLEQGLNSLFIDYVELEGIF